MLKITGKSHERIIICRFRGRFALLYSFLYGYHDCPSEMSDLASALHENKAVTRSVSLETHGSIKQAHL